jgi:oxygen-dependent protoporphyrinogen oxidase
VPQVIAVIGGGIAGLTVAYELARHGQPFVLLEASSRVGGLILTDRADGFTIDAGPDSILAQKPAAFQLCDELGLAPRLLRSRLPRSAFVLKGDRLFTLPSPSVLGIPIGAGALLKYDLLPWRARLRLALEPLVAPGAALDESVASFFRRRFGDETVSLIAEPLLGGIHAGDIEQLSVRALFPRLVEAERSPGRVLRNAAGQRAPETDGPFRSLRGGMIDLVDAIVARLPDDAVRLQSPALSLRRTDQSWAVSAPNQIHDALAVIIAAPSHAAAKLLTGIDGEASRLCALVPYVSTASVALGYGRGDIGHPLEGSGFVVARRHGTRRITACTWVSSKWEARAPDNQALIRAFIGGAHDPGAVELEDGELIDIAIRDLSGLLEIRNSPTIARVYRWKNAGAQHVVGHGARMNELAGRLRALSGLFVTGSGFDSIGIPDCVTNARRVASAALDYVRMRT